MAWHDAEKTEKLIKTFQQVATMLTDKDDWQVAPPSRRKQPWQKKSTWPTSKWKSTILLKFPWHCPCGWTWRYKGDYKCTKCRTERPTLQQAREEASAAKEDSQTRPTQSPTGDAVNDKSNLSNAAAFAAKRDTRRHSAGTSSRDRS